MSNLYVFSICRVQTDVAAVKTKMENACYETREEKLPE